MVSKNRVVVAMSGGVDSSVAAALLKDQGHEIIGMMLRLWSEPGTATSNRCCSPDSMAMARRVAAKLGIPFYVVDAQEEFRTTVVEYFINGYTQGTTPNPCLECNRHIRFKYLLKHAQTLGADFLATGHYARKCHNQDGKFQLLRSIDTQKDQSYVLHVLDQYQLSHALFPLGEYPKTQVRDLARQFNLPIAERPDSQDLCFLAGDDYRSFLARNTQQLITPGNIIHHNGEVLGTHQGLALYTIGQRKGLGVSSPHPLYVINKITESNTLVIGDAQDTYRKDLLVQNINWMSGNDPVNRFSAFVKIRYKAKDAHASIQPHPDQSAQVIFDEPQRDVTPGQAAVFYDGDVCLGGGIIAVERECSV